MKICILVIASHSKEYDELAVLWRSIKYPEWITLRFVYADPESSELVSMKDDIICVRSMECIFPGLLYKTRAAMEYLLNHEEFDYLLRSNLSSFFHAESLLEFIKDKPRQNAMFGDLIVGKFLSGSGYIMTRDVVEKFTKWDYSEHMNPMKTYDDVILGEFMFLYEIPYFTWVMEHANNLKDEKAIQVRCHESLEKVGFNGLDPVYSRGSPKYFRQRVEAYNLGK